MTWIMHKQLWGYKVWEELHLGLQEQKSWIPLAEDIAACYRDSFTSFLLFQFPITQQHSRICVFALHVCEIPGVFFFW
jgi:hypothetical protein